MRQFKEVIGIKRPVKLVEFRVAEPHGIMHGIFFGQDNRYCAWCYIYMSLSSVRCFKIHADRLELFKFERCFPDHFTVIRSEEHTSELQSLMRISYAVFC